MTGFIKNSPELKVFDMGDVIKAFNAHCEKFEFDFQLGQAEALKVIGKIKNDAGAPDSGARGLCHRCVGRRL
jgi:tellurite resistance protein TerB